jgi:hypothetical protein
MKRFLKVLVLTLFALVPMLAHATITYSPTIKMRGNIGDQAMVLAQLDLTGTYATNGFTLTPKDLGLSTINDVIIPNYSGYSFEWVRSTGKVKVTWANADYTPAGSNTAQTLSVAYTSTTSGLVPLYVTDTSGTIALYAVFTSDTSATRSITLPAQTFTGTASAASAAEEVDNGTSLASLNTIEIIVMGY